MTGFLFEESLGKSSLIPGHHVPSDSSGIAYKGQRDRKSGEEILL